MKNRQTIPIEFFKIKKHLFNDVIDGFIKYEAFNKIIKNGRVINYIKYIIYLLLIQKIFIERVEKSWGYYKVLKRYNQPDGYKLKALFIKPSSSLSLQSHNFRAEHFIIIKGIVKVVINEDVLILKEGAYAFVPINAKHQIFNETQEVAVVGELQIGSILSEEDITRY